MARFRSKPVEIEAVQFNPTVGLPMASAPSWLVQDMLAGRAKYEPPEGDQPATMLLYTANGPVVAQVGDWIIREPSGIGCYPCKAGVFAAKYEAID